MPKRGRCWKYYNDDLEKLFGVSRRTLKKWEDGGVFKRGDIFSVIGLYNTRRNDIATALLEMYGKLKERC